MGDWRFCWSFLESCFAQEGRRKESKREDRKRARDRRRRQHPRPPSPPPRVSGFGLEVKNYARGFLVVHAGRRGRLARRRRSRLGAVVAGGRRRRRRRFAHVGINGAAARASAGVAGAGAVDRVSVLDRADAAGIRLGKGGRASHGKESSHHDEDGERLPLGEKGAPRSARCHGARGLLARQKRRHCSVRGGGRGKEDRESAEVSNAQVGREVQRGREEYKKSSPRFRGCAPFGFCPLDAIRSSRSIRALTFDVGCVVRNAAEE